MICSSTNKGEKMKSKEALENIRDYCIEIVKKLDIIEKDLEMVNMLKKNISIQTDYDDETCKEYEYLAYNDLYLDIKSEEEYNKIKDWIIK